MISTFSVAYFLLGNGDEYPGAGEDCAKNRHTFNLWLGNCMIIRKGTLMLEMCVPKMFFTPLK